MGIKETSEQPGLILLRFCSLFTSMRPLLLALLGLCCLALRAVEGVGTEVLDQQICLSLSTQPLPVSRIKTYTIKEGPMKAVIFITKRGIKVCADPQANWVKKAVRTMDKSRRMNVNQTKPPGAQQPTRML